MIRVTIRPTGAAVRTAPTPGYVEGPQHFPEGARTVPEPERQCLADGVDGDRPLGLAPLARRLLVRHQTGSKYDKIGTDQEPPQRRIPARRTVGRHVALKKPEVDPVAGSSLRRGKPDLGPAAVPWKRRSPTLTEALPEPGRRVRFKESRWCPGGRTGTVEMKRGPQGRKVVPEGKGRTEETRGKPIPEATRSGMVEVLRTATINRAAEALRRKAGDRLLIGVATREQVFRQTTERNASRCDCHATAQEVLNTRDPLPEAASNPRLTLAITKALRSLSVGQTVRLDGHEIGHYDFRDEDDEALVRAALDEGRNNPAAYQVLEDSLCIDARQTAETLLRGICLWTDRN